jgi:hypothetical protein
MLMALRQKHIIVIDDYEQFIIELHLRQDSINCRP